MDQARAYSLSYVRFAAQWRAIVLMLILVGRRISDGKKQGNHEAYAQAEMMELWSRAALGALTQQLQVLEDVPHPDAPEDQQARAYLTVATVILLGLAMLAAKMKSELKALSGGASMPVSFAMDMRNAQSPAMSCTPAFLDSG